MERQEVVGIFHAKRVILRSSVYSLSIAWEKGGNRDAQSQTANRKKLTNNQTKNPNGVKTFTFIAWEPPLACLAWKILITNGREVNEKGSCLKISFTSILKSWALAPLQIIASSAKGLSICFYVVSSPSQISARAWEHFCHVDALCIANV